ncbi:MAG: hypothetical protein LBP22_04590 [Deltaproteobacteria bacterium]|nr:hypothetical protein [Deltaproteobacteria bacterium]
MKKILLVVLILFLGIMAALAALAMSIVWNWSAWTALIPLAVIWGGPLAYQLLRAFSAWLARRRYARNILLSEKKTPETEQYSLLRQQWQHGLMALRPASFRGQLDPIKDLGWFLMLGPADSGKADSLSESGLLNIIRTLGGDTAASEREKSGCDWYLFENSVILDVKGIVAEPGGQAGPEEWATFLELLNKTGRRYPLEGVIVTIPAKLMIPEEEPGLRSLLAQDRERLDSLSLATDQSCPVYLMLSLLDQVEGAGDAVRLLEDNGQTPGLLIDPRVPPEAAEIKAKLENELRELFIRKLNPGRPWEVAPVLGAPGYLNHLERGLAIALAILRQKSPYVPAPHLRGLFFSCRAALAEGISRPEIAGDSITGESVPAGTSADVSQNGPDSLNIVRGADQADKKNKVRSGLTGTLSDFFGRILPENGYLTEKLNLSGGRRQKYITGFLAVFYILSALLALAFYQEVRYNRLVSQVIRTARNSAGSLDSLSGDYLSQADRLDYILDQIQTATENLIRKSPWPTRADSYIKDMEEDFRSSFEIGNDQVLEAIQAQIKESPRIDQAGFAVSLRQLLWLFEVFDTYDRKGNFREMAPLFPFLPDDFKGKSQDLWTLVYNKVLFEYLDRKPGEAGPRRVLETVRQDIEQSVGASTEGNLNWLIKWTEFLPNVKPITVAGFWEPYGVSPETLGTGAANAGGEIPGAYTAAGRQAIISTLNQLQKVYERYEGSFVETEAELFFNQYDSEYKDRWHRWIRVFTASSRNVPSVMMFHEALGNLGSSPFTRVLNLLNYNLNPYLDSDQAAPWLKNIELDGAIIRFTALEAQIKQPQKVLEKFEAYRSAAEAIKPHMPNYLYRSDFLHRIITAQPALKEYLEQSNQIEKLLTGQPDDTVKLLRCHFGGASYGDVSQSPFTLAGNALNSYTGLMYSSIGGSDDLVVALRQEALQYLKVQSAGLTARRIDELWQSEVVTPVRFLNDEDTNKALYGPDGLIVKFQKESAAPFLVSSGARGYRAAVWDKISFPFSDDFLHLLSVGNSALTAEPLLDSYQVKISAVASLVDEEAREKPERTTLTLNSADSLQSLDIYNYPISRDFTWKPATAGDTELAIILPSLELYVNYSGPHAFAGFLKDVLKGELIFTPADFPEHEGQLKGLGISQIRVIIKADGALPVVRYLDLKPLPLPASIIKAP